MEVPAPCLASCSGGHEPRRGITFELPLGSSPRAGTGGLEGQPLGHGRARASGMIGDTRTAHHVKGWPSGADIFQLTRSLAR
jgi:hypothetical protein